MSPDTPLDALLWTLLGAVLLPAWLLAGLCDYVAHARAQIERTSGVRESFLHLLQTAQIGLPMLAVLWLEVNAAVLALCAAGVLAHTVTACVDLRYSQPLRHISVFEQFVHAFLIVLPIAALALLAVLHWPAVAAGQWAFERKHAPFAPGIVGGVLLASVLLGVAPGVWEFIRTWRHARQAAAGRG
jgi:hypothetical protein